MNKNILIVGAIAAGLYLFSQGKKTSKAVSKKKAPRRPLHKYYKPKIKRVIAKKKATYIKPQIKIAATRKKPTYYSPKSRIAIARKQQIKRMQWRKRRR